jgi:hypothetical protein
MACLQVTPMMELTDDAIDSTREIKKNEFTAFDIGVSLS